MKNKTAQLIALSVCFMLVVNLGHGLACSPSPWDFKDAYDSKAMIYGKVTRTNNDHREATVKVISYVGPNAAPRIVHMPSTLDGRKDKQDSPCPDFSMRFQTGAEYVFFLSDIPPHLQLLAPQWKTATLVENGQATVGMPRGELDDVHLRLRQFAQAKGYAVQSPDKQSPAWGSSTPWSWLIFIVIAACSLIGGFIYYLYRRRVNRENTR